MERLRKLKKKFILASAVISLTIPLASVFYFYYILDPYSETSSSAVISLYLTFRSELILSSYAKQLELKQKFFREPYEPPRGLPRHLEVNLMTILSQGSLQDRENIIKFYAKALSFTNCCWQMAKYENKLIIGDVLRIAQTLDDREKLAALELAESLRRNFPLFKTSLNTETPQDIAVVLKLYQTWWQLPIAIEEKLRINPLEKSSYFWSEL